MSTTDFGPVATTWYNPEFSETGDARGFSIVQLGGHMPVPAAKTLKELSLNRDDRTTKQGVTGILMWITCPYPVMDANQGYYILTSFNWTPYKFSADTIAAAFSLVAAYFGDME